MQQDAADGVSANATSLIASAIDVVSDADAIRAFSLKREFRRVSGAAIQCRCSLRSDHAWPGNDPQGCLLHRHARWRKSDKGSRTTSFYRGLTRTLFPNISLPLFMSILPEYVKPLKPR